jgi:hypothetical protein
MAGIVLAKMADEGIIFYYQQRLVQMHVDLCRLLVDSRSVFRGPEQDWILIAVEYACWGNIVCSPHAYSFVICNLSLW